MEVFGLYWTAKEVVYSTRCSQTLDPIYPSKADIMKTPRYFAILIFAMLSQFSLPDNIKICCQYLMFSISDSWGAGAKGALWFVDNTSSSLLTLEKRIWSFHYKIAPSTLPARCNSKLLNYVLWHLGAKVIKSANEPLLTAHVLPIFGEWYLIDVRGQSSIV